MFLEDNPIWIFLESLTKSLIFGKFQSIRQDNFYFILPILKHITDDYKVLYFPLNYKQLTST